MKRENFWVKLSSADRLTRAGPPYDDVAPFARRMAEIAPGRCLWGSDWPHTGVFDSKRMPADGQLLDLLLSWFSEEQRKAILVKNPCKLLEP